MTSFKQYDSDPRAVSHQFLIRSGIPGEDLVTKNRKRRKRSQKQGWKRLWRKGISAVLLVLLVLAFLRIQEAEKAGGTGSPAPGSTQETQTETHTEASAEPPAETHAGTHAETHTEPPAGTHAETHTEPPSEAPANGTAERFTLEMVPPYSGSAYADINDDVPFFSEEEMTAEAFHEYWPLDELGRCTGAYACVGPETLPKQKRGDISMVRPTGWNTNRYDGIDGEMLFNRCHLIGHLLTGQDANERNLITGTRYMNVEGMLPFEESVVRYVEGTGHHVMYRVRPYFDGDDLVCRGVLMEARSVEDPLVQFCAFCYNVQPGIMIDYATGDNWRGGP